MNAVQIMRSLEMRASLRLCLPAQVFFNPRQIFVERVKSIMQERSLTSFVDIGSGMGKVVDVLSESGVKGYGIDMYSRDNRSEKVRYGNSYSHNYKKNELVLICRPNHDGWSADCIESAILAGCTIVYAGLPKNAKTDMQEFYRKWAVRIENVGHEKESMYVFYPEYKRLRK